VARETSTKCETCGSGKLKQDPDVLDTWFSSGLWPFSTLGWPRETKDLKTYYPTSLLITGYDILFFWVARMIMLGIHFTGQVPFCAVYLHSLVRTGSGEKMSKSKGTGLDPVLLNKQYGTDAMRFCLASMAAPGTDIVLSDDRLAGARNFANKIWNAARFLFVNLEKFEQGGATLQELAAPEIRANAPYKFEGAVPLRDAWIFARLAATTEQMNDALANYRFHDGAQGVYQFFWGDFCDWYIEWVKPDLQSGDNERAIVAWRNLFAVFEAALRLLHPFMPFLTEELWQQFPQQAGAKSIALERFPEVRDSWRNNVALEEFGVLQEIITAVRNIRAEMKLDPKKRVAAELSLADEMTRASVESNRDGIVRLGMLTDLKISGGRLVRSGGAVRSSAKFDLRIEHTETVDAAAECAKITKELEGLRKAIGSKEKQLGDETFRSRAPEKIIRGLEATLETQRIEMQKLTERFEQLDC
jgi:valyl-tRNA synthetase